MTNTKYRWTSTTIIAQFVAVVAFLLSSTGIISLDDTLQQDIVTWIGSAIALISQGIAIRGRIRASSKLVHNKPLP